MGIGRQVSSIPVGMREQPYMHGSVCTLLETQRCRAVLSLVQVQTADVPEALPAQPEPELAQ
jgi:hypothetical protein